MAEQAFRSRLRHCLARRYVLDGRVINRCVYNILGINAEGRKDLLGMYVSESEGANFWLSVLTNLQQRYIRYTDCLYR